MSFLSRYTDYLNNNPEHYWFKRKVYGWGWVPATWQGWLSLAVFLGILLWIFVPFVGSEPNGEEAFWFLAKIALWVCALIGTCYVTGEPPKWQWGLPRNS